MQPLSSLSNPKESVRQFMVSSPEFPNHGRALYLPELQWDY